VVTPTQRLTVFLSWLVAGLLLAAPAVRAETPEEIFHGGNAAYSQEDYETAASEYTRLLRYRIADPRVEYNLANAHFKLGDLGLAILHYERARQLDPTDPEIRDNLEFARSFTIDRVDPTELPTVVRVLRDMQDELGPDHQAWIVLVLFWAVAGLIVWILMRPERWKAAYGWMLAAGVVLLLVGAVSWYSTHQRLSGTPLAVILVDSVDVLAGPGNNNAVLFTVHEGLTVAVRGEPQLEWIRIGLPNGLNGWVPRGAAGEV